MVVSEGCVTDDEEAEIQDDAEGKQQEPAEEQGPNEGIFCCAFVQTQPERLCNGSVRRGFRHRR